MIWSKFLAELPQIKQHLFNQSRFSFAPRPDLNIGMGSPDFSLFIGDNLEVLRFLLKKDNLEPYDLIFIDPPYNSRKDAIINDYPSSKSSIWYNGCTHLQWLKMMYNRLFFSSKLLNPERGVILLCCDDKEHPYLRLMLDLILGENNFIGTYIWKSFEGVKDNAIFTHSHTYILIYAKNLKSLKKVIKESKTHALFKQSGSILDSFDSSIKAREELFNTLGIISEKIKSDLHKADWIRFLNPKPLDLLGFLLEKWTFVPNARVLDLFSGTSSLLISSMHHNLKKQHQVSVSGIQYPFPLVDFFRSPRAEYPEISKLVLSDLTLIRLKQTLIQNSWNEKYQIRVWKQILKPRNNFSKL
ncbi:MAG: hypothetical protein DRO88_06530 [Promethearchaeia archaeon]|nr:MAG: hypothetical protein DRO88_06530 [Candidatus Lokiarchaeia archaeon]